MSVNVCPLGPSPQFELASGAPAVGYQLFFYVAGSNTKQNTYTDSTGGVANTNPIILDALGMPTNTQIWFTSGLTYKIVYAPIGDTDPPSSPIKTWDNLKGINDITVSTAPDQWVNPGLTPTYTSATQFTLVGDQTTNFHVGRRLKTLNTSGTIYSTITVSAYGALTTITVVNDLGGLDGGLSSVSYGLLTQVNPSIPTPYIGNVTGNATTATTATNLSGTPAYFAPITASLGANVALNNVANYFDGPSVAQGAIGRWFVSGTVTILTVANADLIYVKLWDGATVIASTSFVAAYTNSTASLSGILLSPAGNLRISVRDASNTTANIAWTLSGNNKDSTITAFRIG